ncbi:hypothetical protein T439DRAFT_321466 [Meredithblackwellia eburnea MCA 4105]
MSGFLTKIAHNNRVSLGPKDTRSLAELISAEKKFLDATQRLSSDRTRASLALKEWGATEGPDLGDILTKLSQLFDYLSAAEVAFGQHDNNFRLHFKSVRTKEENLASLKRSQSSLASKIESQEKKVSKMKEENKDLPMATTKLHEMKQEMVGLENTVINEESKLSDFKRSATKEAMSLKLGAMLELAEKTVIIGELGKLIVDEIPTERTDPGMPRANYHGFDRTEVHMNEAVRCLGEVVFNPTPLSPGPDDRRESDEERYPNGAPAAPSAGGFGQLGAGPSHGALNGPGGAQYATFGPGTSQAYQSQHHLSTSATYGSQYGGEYYGNSPTTPIGGGSDAEEVHYRGGDLQAPGLLPTIRTTSPLPPINVDPHSPAPSHQLDNNGDWGSETNSPNPASIASPSLPPGAGPGKNSQLLGALSRGYEDPSNNRSSLAYMDEEDEDDHHSLQRRDNDATPVGLANGVVAEKRSTLPAIPSQPQQTYDHHLRNIQPPNPSYLDNSAAANSPASQYTDGAGSIAGLETPDLGANTTISTSTANTTAPSSPGGGTTTTGAFSPTRPSANKGSTSAGAATGMRGESALGSKHGDVYVRGANGANNGGMGGSGANEPTSPGGFLSGYNDAASVGSSGGGGGGGGGVVSAGAFRRFRDPTPKYSLPPQHSDSRYPTASASIRDEYYAANGGNGGVGRMGALEDHTESPRGTVVDQTARYDDGPRFDVSPLHVQKRTLAGGLASGSGHAPPTRSGSLPVFPAKTGVGAPLQPMQTNSNLQNSYAESHNTASEGESTLNSASLSSSAPPPAYNSGFGASNFVTRLD